MALKSFPLFSINNRNKIWVEENKVQDEQHLSTYLIFLL